MKLHSERKPDNSMHISRIMSRFLAAEKRYSPILFWSVNRGHPHGHGSGVISNLDRQKCRI